MTGTIRDKFGGKSPEDSVLSSHLPEIAFLAVLACFTILAAQFAAAQDIWVDETTQLSGLKLGPVEVVRWLAGENTQRFGVPGDRTPPLSYWVGWMWSHLMGLSEGSMRGMGILAVGAAGALVNLAARRAWGKWAGVLAAGVFLLSPNVLAASAEIRAYPLFLLTSAATLYFCVRVAEAGTPAARDWVGLGLCCLAGVYTHFFGVVLAGAVISGVGLLAVRRKEFRWPLVMLVAAVGAGSMGLIPFVRGAGQVGGVPAEGGFLVGVVRFIYRALIGHPSLGVEPLVPALGVAAFGAMLAVAMRGRSAGKQTHWLLCGILLAGCTVVVAARCVHAKFDALGPNYNLWRAPLLAGLAGSAVAIGSAWWKRVGVVAALALLVLGAFSCLMMDVHGDVFRHTPKGELVAALERSRCEAVVYDGAEEWGGAYFPLVYSQGTGLRQYLVKTGADGNSQILELPSLRIVDVARELPSRVLLVTVRTQNAADTVAACRGGAPRVALSAAGIKTLSGAAFERGNGGVLAGQEAMAYSVFARRNVAMK